MTSQSFNRIKIPTAFWVGISQTGIKADDVIRQAGLPISILTEQVPVSTRQYFTICKVFSELIDDPAAGIKLMLAMNTAQMPPSLLAPYHARDFHDALFRVARYKQLFAPERLHITEEGEHCTIELELLSDEINAPPLLVDATWSGLMELGRGGTGKLLKAHLVELSRPSDDMQFHQAYFGCPILVNAKYNRLTLYRNDLYLPFITYNAELLEILVPALEQSINEQQSSRSITEKIKWILRRSLTGGRPDIRIVSSELGISERTLQRRLTKEATSFHQLLSEARREMAREYLANPSLDIQEVAYLLGYEDQSSFYRAFRIWEGETPANWRVKQWTSDSKPQANSDLSL
ncbi:helix-turn-helix domain-containing protein [Paenibacillus lautus]|uniref:helix-turn-helix transcriptional regulator n=1 Tax=Paenibacillus lautus TaxID=1401 RepID=UPI003D2CA9B2